VEDHNRKKSNTSLGTIEPYMNSEQLNKFKNERSNSAVDELPLKTDGSAEKLFKEELNLLNQRMKASSPQLITSESGLQYK
jgi:hypothetical protein